MTFYAGMVVMALISLARVCFVTALRHYRVDREWLLLEQQELDTAHSAL